MSAADSGALSPLPQRIRGATLVPSYVDTPVPARSRFAPPRHAAPAQGGYIPVITLADTAPKALWSMAGFATLVGVR